MAVDKGLPTPKPLKQLAILAGLFPANGSDADFLAYMKGQAGVPGTQLRSGAGVPPDTLGADGDQYSRTTTGDVYTRVNGAYVITANNRGPVGPSGMTLTGLTGGSLNSLVWLKSDGVTCEDFDPTLLDVAGIKTLLWKDDNGVYNLPKSKIVVAAGNLQVDYIRVAVQKQADTDPNFLDIDPVPDPPANVAPTNIRAYLEIGKNIQPGAWIFDPKAAYALTTPAPVSRYDSLLVANYPRGTDVPTTRFRLDRWAAYTNGKAYGTTPTIQYPHGALIEFVGPVTGNLKLASDEVTGAFLDGQWQAELSIGAGGSELAWVLRAGGTPAAPTGVLLRATTGSGPNNVRLVTLVNGTETTVGKKITAQVDAVSMRGLIGVYGTLVVAKIWPAASPMPRDWMLIGHQTAVTAAGFAGGASTYGNLQLSSISSVTGNGSQAALTGNT